MTAQQIIEKARSYIGIVEEPINKVIFNTAYYGRAVTGSSYPWCCSFVWYVFHSVGADNLFYDGKKTAYCPTLMNWARSKGRLFFEPQIGDIAFYNFSRGKTASHTGIVTAIGNGYIMAVEGNTSPANNANGGMVLERRRMMDVCLGFYRPQYDDAPKKVDTSDYPMIMKGYTGAYVRLCQQALTMRGFPTSADGIFGNDTKAQVKKFQKSMNLEVDGIVGPITWKALFS